MNVSGDYGFNPAPQVRISLPPIAYSSPNSPRISPGNSPMNDYGYKVSIQDVISSNKKISDDWGVSGYQIPKFNPHMDKPVAYQLAKDKSKGFFAEIQKAKSYIPGPTYDTSVSMIMKQKMSISKLPRITFAEEIIKKASKLPSPGQYNTEKKQKPVGTFIQQSERIGFLDDASYLSSLTPAHYDSTNLDTIRQKNRVARIYADKREKGVEFEKDDSPSPNSYPVEHAFKNIKPRQYNVRIGKQKDLNFIERTLKTKSLIPSVGQYEVTTADKYITKGKKSYR
ncbi:UNKNOWN [Stylonychia lemnae]|uniref:Uncharacterized protein n=1 Tax=Stylonychia lemnae TaxID=5949 RepID=A0A078B3H1_STYLE|nr:UNKNOWN [Stylonychia lemnae]|eukprot:CDW88053.1 UNKNOWN [Stylonychia lemnae]